MTNNKVALVTGGAQGISFKIVGRLAEDGFRAAVVDFDEEGVKATALKLSSDGIKATAIKADVSNHDDVLNAVRQTAAQFGDFHVMVNNVGLGPTTPIDTIAEEQFKTVYGVNVAGVLWGIQVAYEQFRKSNHGGKIINAISQTGVKGNPSLSLYYSTRFAVRGLTQVAAQDLASEGIIVNAFAPGIVQAPMMESIAMVTAEGAGRSEAWGWEQSTGQTALGRVPQPEDVSNVVSFLAGKDSDYITGQVIIADDGTRFR